MKFEPFWRQVADYTKKKLKKNYFDHTDRQQPSEVNNVAGNKQKDSQRNMSLIK